MKKRYTIKATITLNNAPITVMSDTPITTEKEAQEFIDRQGFGSPDFNLDLADESIEVYDVHEADDE